MSRETARALADAKGAEADQVEVVDTLKRELLDAVAAGLPDRLDEYLKAIAHRQAGVTKALGRDGIAALRKEISDAADDLAVELRQSADKIEWPTFAYGSSRNKGVHSSLFHYFYGSRANNVDRILRLSGYTIEQHGGLHPHSLYERGGYDDIERQLAILAAKRNDVARAEEDDDHDTVDSIWNDSSEGE